MGIADEILPLFGILTDTAINDNDSRSVIFKNSRIETVALLVLADGRKLKLFVILERKEFLKEKL